MTERINESFRCKTFFFFENELRKWRRRGIDLFLNPARDEIGG